MIQFNYSLDVTDYTLNNALLYGVFYGHCKRAMQGRWDNRVVHVIIAALELVPVVSQVVSLFEMFMVMSFSKPSSRFFNTSQNENRRDDNSSSPIPLKDWPRDKVKEYHQRIAPLRNESPLLTYSRWSDSQVMPSMKGLALLSSTLIDKHKQKSNSFKEDSLFVCETLRDFKAALKTIKDAKAVKEPIRRAFIVPTHSTKFGHKENGVLPRRFEEFPQHIFTVVVEKKENELCIALLDPMMRLGNEIITPNHIGLAPELANVPFTEQGLVLSYIVDAGLDSNTTKLYYSSVYREKSNGCWAFALKDAIAFIKTLDFFDCDSIKKAGVVDKIHNLDLRKIEVLPIRFMTTAQLTDSAFEEHFQSHSEQDSISIREKIAKHRIQDQNHRIAHATVKWLQLLTGIS